MKEYQVIYDSIINEYRISPNDSVFMSLQGKIQSKALETKMSYAEHKYPREHELIAMIFALWTISKSTKTNEGIEFLYNPHPAQIITILLILGASTTNGLGNRLAQVLTGEGKSVVLAGLACYLALIGKDVSVVCYS
jgi:hypothetical protein